MRGIHRHFSVIAHQYRDLRTTDLEPIVYIEQKLKGMARIRAADVGCGAGRYDLKLFQHLGKKLHLSCIDANGAMLRQLRAYLRAHHIENFQTIRASAGKLSLPNDSLDALFTFNAIHHFRMSSFLRETSRALKTNGHAFIYTRLRSQNRRNIWGRYFPRFHQKETRLYALNELKTMVKRIPRLCIESIEVFSYRRRSTLRRLMEQAKQRHYSTFSLYTKEEFQQSVETFERNILRRFADEEEITWYDGNILLVIRRVGSGTMGSSLLCRKLPHLVVW